jgi:hypothetical protein
MPLPATDSGMANPCFFSGRATGLWTGMTGTVKMRYGRNFVTPTP